MSSESESPRYLPRTYALHGDAIVASLAEWFEREGRAFAWRADAHDVAERTERGVNVGDPYVVLVSEVMLQQTQASRVAAMLPAFLARFPDVRALAAASRGDVIRAWQGLGYNNRAVRLHETATAIVQSYGGEFPRDLARLRTLPGIGAYTASAIACFAFGAQVPVVDVNIQRVLSRLFYKCYSVDARMAIDAITRLDAALLPERGAYWWHQALMDVGATVCTARRPACERCPLATLCLSAFPRIDATFGATTAAEPMIAATPRRIWRGRIVEVLRRMHRGLALAELIDALPQATTLGSDDRLALRRLVSALVAEGMLVVEASSVRDGDVVVDATIVRLPE